MACFSGESMVERARCVAVNFVTTGFALFFLPVLCIGWGLRRHYKAYTWFLLAANILFYALAGIAHLPFLFLIAFINWWCVRAMDRKGRRKRLMLVSAAVAAHVMILAFFKYYEAVALGMAELFGQEARWLINSSLASWVLPVGLSFYSFQGLSYTIDHYREDGLASRSYAELLCFLSFFPTVMSGPIMRENNFFPQLRTSFAGEEDFPEGVTLILSGLFKKGVMSSCLQSRLVDAVFAAPDEYSSAAALMAVYAYSVQIYCDFSGYTNIAMGVAQLMGFHIPKNFDDPYRALSLQEFWHRWHISLSTWLRDYLYIPLGGSRKGNRYVNLMITMIIGGIWHGSSLGFLVWGALHGVGLALVHAWHRLTGKWQMSNRALRGFGNVVSWALTLHVVALLWVFFRAETLTDAQAVLARVTAWTSEGAGFPLVVLVATLWGVALSFCGTRLYRAAVRGMSVLPWPVQGAVAGLAIAFIVNLGPDGVFPFIYMRF